MEAANASMYDGASASAEAFILATNVTKRKKVVVSETVNPNWRDVVKTYLSGRNVELVTVPQKNGQTDYVAMADVIDEETAAVLVMPAEFFRTLFGSYSKSYLR